MYEGGTGTILELETTSRQSISIDTKKRSEVLEEVILTIEPRLKAYPVSKSNFYSTSWIKLLACLILLRS